MSILPHTLPAPSSYPISRREWDRRIPSPTDIISVRNLSISATVSVDGWGRWKYQPVLISITLSLAQSVASAAASDEVDQSTVHYGNLSKNVMQAVGKKAKEEMVMEDFIHLVEDAACGTVPFPALIETLEVEVFLSKGSLAGKGAGLQWARAFGIGEVSRVLFLRDVGVRTVIGVNQNEREMKQQVVANLWVDPITKSVAMDMYPLMEKLLVKASNDFS
ncbi:MAG: hypothetical protein M1827_003842 [Pycnora praestabilis]|nr:MAG: hypothetical protein M1827_003842 [Pycnora praestabilis]